MVAKPHRLEVAIRAIQRALGDLVQGFEGSRVRVEVNEWGHLDVVLGSDKFKGMADGDRDEVVWTHLRTNLDKSDFGELSDVSVLDIAEYQRQFETEQWVNRIGGGTSGYPTDFPL